MATTTDSLPPAGYFHASRGADPEALIRANPLAYVLACVIAHRARWNDAALNPYNLKTGESALGDYENYGMSEQQYRTAKSHLEKWGLATFRPTNRGTVGKLTDKRLFFFIRSDTNGQDRTPTTGQQRASNGLANRPATTNEERRAKSKEPNSEPRIVEARVGSAGNSGEACATRGSFPEELPPSPAKEAALNLAELMHCCAEVLGKAEMKKQHRRWLKRAETEPDRLERVIAEVRVQMIEHRTIANPGAYAEDLWKRFK